MFFQRRYVSRNLLRAVTACFLAISIIGMSLFALSPVHAASDYHSEAATSAGVLQSYYSSSNGLWNTGDSSNWWQSANLLETTINYMVTNNNSDYSSDIATTFNDNKSGNFLNNYYDDEGWWALAWIKAYDFTNNSSYLDMAKTIFADMTGGWDNTCNGGVWWSKDRTYKNAIPNELFLEIAARLHQRVSGDTVGGGGPGGYSYIDWATKEWNWFNNSGMINGSHLINDGLTSSCGNNGQATYTYNQGVVLGGLVALYQSTNNSTYLSTAETLANASTTQLVNSSGVLVDPCEPSNCGGDGAIFKGIYVKNLIVLYQVDNKSSYHDFILHNADSLWINDRDSTNHFGVVWSGPVDRENAARQGEGQDLLNAAATVTGSSATSFATGFESGDPQPTWSNTVDGGGQPAGGINNVSGVCCGISGPEAGTRNETTHNGSSALMYSGYDTNSTSSYAYLKVFDLSGAPLSVDSTTVLDYWIYPQSTSTNSLVSGNNSSCVAIDLIFRDSSGNLSNLRDSGATDQNGNRAHPAYQCNHLTMDSWNHVSVKLGAYKNGQSVIRIDIGYDQPANTGGYRGYVDDVSIY